MCIRDRFYRILSKRFHREIKTQASGPMKLVETEQDKMENISIPKRDAQGINF